MFRVKKEKKNTIDEVDDVLLCLRVLIRLFKAQHMSLDSVLARTATK